MEFILENFEYIVLALLLMIFVLVIRLIISHGGIRKYLLNKKYKITSFVVYDVEEKTERIEIRVFNQNINDVRMTSLGFVYKDKNIDYYQKYLKDNNFNLDHEISIPSRGFIVFSLDVMEFKNLVKNLNQGKKRVSKVEVYVVDSIGATNKIAVKNLRKHLIKINKEETKANKLILKSDKVEFKVEKKQERKIRINKRKESNRNRWDKLRLKIKNIFTKKK